MLSPEQEAPVVNEFLARLPSLNLDQQLPTHIQIERWLLDGISARRLCPNDRLPNEREFAAALSVSRMTLRQALAGLEARGILTRTPGRNGGAFILEPKINCDLTGLAGFTEQLRRANVRAGARNVRTATVPASKEAAKALELNDGAPVHEIERTRTANRTPVALERSYLPADRFPDLLSHHFTGSLYAVLHRHYDQAPHTALEHLKPVIADPEQAEALGVELGAPLMLIERTAYSVAGVPVEFARDLVRPDRIQITLRTDVHGTTGTPRPRTNP